MTSTALEVNTSTQTPRLFWYLLCIFMFWALIPTLWPAVDIAAANWFNKQPLFAQAHQWWWVGLINQYTPAFFRTLVVLALIAWIWSSLRMSGKAWRLPLAFVVVAGILGPGLAVNLGFKDHWQRARPHQVEEFGGAKKFTRATIITDQCNSNCSFVSGHVACGFFLMSMMLVQRKRKIAWALSGTLAGLVIGFARMADHAHWFSDVLWACPITLLSSWLVWKFLLWTYQRPLELQCAATKHSTER